MLAVLTSTSRRCPSNTRNSPPTEMLSPPLGCSSTWMPTNLREPIDGRLPPHAQAARLARRRIATFARRDLHVQHANLLGQAVDFVGNRRHALVQLQLHVRHAVVQVVDILRQRDALADRQVPRRRIARVLKHFIDGVEEAGQRAAQVRRARKAR